MRPRTVRKLSGLEIDEVSLVDRPANQHGLVAFAKRDEESSMDPIFDAEGNEVDPDQLEHGDVVYAEDGQELVFVEDGEPGGGIGEVDDGQYGGYDGDQFADGTVGYAVDDEAYEASGVGKAFPRSLARAHVAVRRTLPNRAKEGLRSARDRATSSAASNTRAAESAFSTRGSRGVSRAKAFGQGQFGARPGTTVGVAGGGTAALGGAGYYGSGRRDRVGKSLGEQVSKALSKALTEDERDAVISKAMDLLGDVADRNDQLEQIVAELIEDRELETYGEIAKSYEGLPVEPDEFGGILHRVASVLDPNELATLDRVFKAAGDAGLYDEVGYGGPGSPAGANEILEQVYAVAGQAVGKSESGITAEQAVTAIFEANPAAYDEYEAEQRGLR